MMTRFISLSILLGSLGCAALLTPTHALAKDGQNAALIGGFAAGAVVGGVIGNAMGSQGAPNVAPTAEQPPPPRPMYRHEHEYVERAPTDEAPDCHLERRKTFDEDGNFRGFRRVRVCD